MIGPVKLALEEQLGLGGDRNFVCDILFSDLTPTAATTKVLTIQAYLQQELLRGFCFKLITPFVGASITGLTLQVGVAGASLYSNQAAFIGGNNGAAPPVVVGQELCASGYKLADDGIVTAVNTGTVGASSYDAATSGVISSARALLNDRNSRTLATQESGNITALFTATGANLSALTAGQVRLFFGQFGLSKYNGFNNL